MTSQQTDPDISQELVHIPAGLPRRMYYWMQDRAGDKDGVTVSASLQHMVDQLGSNRQHVIKSIHSLEEAGVVEVTRTKNEWGIPGPNTYTVI
ncbi:MAG: hypothetical protein M3P94_03345, partial [Chloroflexota bacterium]|nr:hypothetical protein [Chloroflexota bacterium]